MPGEYSDNDLLTMQPEEIAAAAARGWAKPALDPADMRPNASGDVWKRKKTSGNVFTCPSGQTCRLRPLSPELLLTAGILDKVTRLEGLAQKLISVAEGEPPAPQVMPTREDFAEVLYVVNVIVPIAVIEPKVYADVEPGQEAEDCLYVSEIDLDDRLAIMQESLKGIRALDRFRNS